MDIIKTLQRRVLAGELLGRSDAFALCGAPLEALCAAADVIRQQFCGDGFDLCTIVNGKCGRCSEDCKYCAQSVYYHTPAKEYPLLDTDVLLKQAQDSAARGVLRYSIVTSGKRLSDDEVARMCESIRAIRDHIGIAVCISFGLLDEVQFHRLREAGVSRVHCNLETSRRYFPSVCTTHTYDEKLETLRAARRAGLSLCSGGIIGLGETMEDRIDMALTLRDLGIKSVPVNFLNPIPGTPYAHNAPLSDTEKRRVIALYRFLLPDAAIRLAGGRGLLPDKGEACFRSGVNAAISGDMLTTAGITIETDRALLARLGYEVRMLHE